MPEEIEDTGEGQEQTSQEGVELQRQLQAANDKAAQATVYAKLAQDPDFAKLMQYKAAGKKFSVVEADTQAAASLSDGIVPPKPEAEIDFENMSQKDLFAHLLRENAKLTEQMISKAIQPVAQQQEQFMGFAQKQELERAKAEVHAVRAKYPDFDRFGEEMLQISQSAPTLTAQQLYVLAKTNAGEPIVEGRQIQSERPVNFTGGSSSQQSRKRNTPLPPGVAGMRMAIEESVNKLRSSGLLPDVE